MDGLRNELRELIASTIDSLETLEIVSLLRRSSQTFWAPPAIADRLNIGEHVARAKLEMLHARAVVTVGEQTIAYRYRPADERVERLIDELLTAYNERRVAVINAIYSANLERLRAFSDAFRVK